MDDDLQDLLEPRWRRFVPLLLAAALSVAVVAGMLGQVRGQYQKMTPSPPPAAKRMQDAKPGQKPSLSAAGLPTAKVKIEVWLNVSNSCQWDNVKIMRSIAKSLPNRLQATFHATDTADGQKAAAKRGITCQAQVMVNGQKSFKVTANGEHKTVELHGPIGSCEPEDLEAVLHAALGKQYGASCSEAELSKLHEAVQAALTAPGKADGETKSDEGHSAQT